MLETLLFIQYIGIVIIIAEFFYVVFQKPSAMQIKMLLLLLSLFLTFVGYTFELSATNLKEAMMAIKFNYLGKPFIMLCTLGVVLDYCRISLAKIWYFLLAAVAASITLLVYTSDTSDLFYSSYYFTEEGLFPHVVLGHGILYNVYVVVVLLYSAVLLGICAWKWKKTVLEREKQQMLLFALGVFLCILSFVVFQTGVLQGYDCTLLGYLAAAIVLSFSYFRLEFFDVATLAKEQAVEQLNTGVVVYDNADRLIFQNGQAAFLGVEEQQLRELAENDGYYFRRDRAYDVKKQKVEKKGVQYGTMYVITDVTDSYNYAERLEKLVEEKTEHIQAIQRKTTLGMADMVESRDSSTGGHVKRTSDVVKIFVEKLKRCKTCGDEKNYSDAYYNNVINAAPMHDLGKIAVDDAVLRKPGAFTDLEYAQMKTHAQKGARIVEQVLRGVEDDAFLNIAINIAHFHHEKWNGQGYPSGKTGEEIPYEARIMALADVFDALVSKRCYKESMPYDKAFQIIEESLGSHFDEELGRHFLECRDELIAYYESVEH